MIVRTHPDIKFTGRKINLVISIFVCIGIGPEIIVIHLDPGVRNRERIFHRCTVNVTVNITGKFDRTQVKIVRYKFRPDLDGIPDAIVSVSVSTDLIGAGWQP
ncbi:MAG: hypothetical protein MAGBODY4_01098 [Candidatus Marinimicrobia bacterium]|nr:hypothetical protein [Candidatus Neomarinimicrobiota bacterium]